MAIAWSAGIMVYVSAGQYDSWWFGVAWAGLDFVATAIGSTRDSAIQTVQRCVPEGVKTHLAEAPSSFVKDAVTMLGELERGNEAGKHFTLSAEHLSVPLRRILTAAAAIPIGYVTTYGNIAVASGSRARAVGRVMATNPLYPIVPCHRVVGAGMSLVGYGGKQDARALATKLSRLQAETRGVAGEKDVDVPDGLLTVYPTEWVVNEARAQEERRLRAVEREAERAATDRRQLRLF
ncbi:MAG: MGMT family protein [Spirochaetales bacterium]|nr:MGMT family protein [Spirochaetales bacterium]